jgi:hypothetical protein
MNVLFIGPYRQQDEWGRKSRAILQSLQRSQHNITARPIFLSSSNQYDTYQEIAEHNISNSYDMLIQFLLQPYAVYNGSIAKNIGIFNSETLPAQVPIAQLTKELLMDEIWTESDSIQQRLQQVLQDHTNNTKVVAMPPSLDVEHLSTTPSVSIKSSHPDLANKFIFYYIGNPMDDKDAFKETLIAYSKAFCYQDEVCLIVFSDIVIPQEKMESVLKECTELMHDVRPPTQKPMIKFLMPPNGVWSTEERVALHIEGDCLVAPSYSLSATSTVLEAGLYNSTPIINKGNAAFECLTEENSWGIESYEDICMYKTRPLNSRFTSNELWRKPIIRSLSAIMKTCFLDKFKRDEKIKANSQLRNYFSNISYENLLK